MNYLTNYYKNLSEKLQEKVNLLESYLNQVNEDLSAGTISQGYGTSTSSSTNQNQNNNPELNSLLAAWGPVNSNSGNAQYDLNGDGFVDGDDLGQFLANMSNGGGGPVVMASTSAATPGTQSMGGKTPRLSGKASAAQTANISSNYGSGMGTNTPSDPNDPLTGNNSELQLLLRNWGTNNPNFDYNRDGIVDGDDLGIVLSRIMSAQNNSQNNPQLAEPTLSGGNIGNARNRNTITAIDQPGVAGNFGQGSPGSYGDGGSPRPPAPKPGPGGRRPTVTGVDNYTNMGNPVTPGGGSPRPPSPKPPYTGPRGRNPTNSGVDVYTNFGNPVTPGGGSPRPPAPKPGPGGRGPTNTGVGVYTPSGNPVTPGGGSPRPPAPKPGPGGRPMQPTAGGFDTIPPTPNPFDIDSGFGNFGNPRTPPKQPIRPTKTGPNFGTQSEIGSGFDLGSGIPPAQTPMSGTNQGGIPYWMSQRTTQTDAGFRAMQRRKRG